MTITTIIRTYNNKKTIITTTITMTTGCGKQTIKQASIQIVNVVVVITMTT